MTDDTRRDRPDTDLPERERANPEELRDWELVQFNDDDEDPDTTERLKIANGWLYRTTSNAGVAMVFVPDMG